MGLCGNCAFRASDEDPAGFQEPRQGFEPSFPDLRDRQSLRAIASRNTGGRAGRQVESGNADTVPYLTSDMSLGKGARLLVQGNMPAEWAHTQDDTATEHDAA